MFRPRHLTDNLKPSYLSEGKGLLAFNQKFSHRGVQVQLTKSHLNLLYRGGSNCLFQSKPLVPNSGSAHVTDNLKPSYLSEGKGLLAFNQKFSHRGVQVQLTKSHLNLLYRGGSNCLFQRKPLVPHSGSAHVTISYKMYHNHYTHHFHQ